MAKKKAKRHSGFQAPKQAGKPLRAEPEPAAAKADAVPARPLQPRRSRSGTFSWWLLGGGVVAVVVVVVVLSVVLGEDQTGVTDASAWDLPALDEDNDPDGDGRVTLADFSGTPLVVNFFASWCVACDRELPLFRQAIDDFGDQVQIVFVNSNETGNWRPMAERNGIDDQILVDDIGGSRNNGLYRSLGGTGGMPITAFYDAEGRLVTTFPGELDAVRLYDSIEALIG